MIDRAVLLENALDHHGAGRLDAAEEIYQQLLAVDPDDADALHLCGLIASARNEHELAWEKVSRAAALAPGNALFHNNLATVLLALGRLDEAAAALERALHFLPDYPQALRNLGQVLTALGNHAAAGDRYRAALRLQPDDAECWYRFGLSLRALGRLDQAVDVLRHATSLRPNDPKILAALADMLQRAGQSVEADTIYRQTLALNPDQADSWANFGTLLQAQGQLEDAAICYRQSLRVEPDNLAALHNLAIALKNQHQSSEAIIYFRRVLALDPRHVEGMTGLAAALQSQGDLETAIPLYERALDLRPALPEALNNMMFALCGLPGITSERLREMTCTRVAAALPSQDERAFANGREVGRRLKIGYVSPDLRRHPVGYFMAAVLPHHDPAQIESFCYSNSRIADDLTARLKGVVHHWRDISMLDDNAVIELIRTDGIDLLIDLSGHMADHRLGVFARRAAPIQASWLGYFSTTGVPAMDLIIADATIIPAGEEAFYTETVARLPEPYLCYDCTLIDLPLSPPPVEATGLITFGCLNRRDKINAPLIACWAEILRRVPESRLLLKTGSFSDGQTRDAMIADFAAQGIDAGRLVLEGHTSHRHHLAAYHRIDIALDSFPYGGATTTLETLWMGVPLVTLRGEVFVSRVGASVLKAAGVPEFIAETAEDYIDLACDLARDRPRLAALRSDLRDRMARGPCNGEVFTRHVETLFRTQWRAWCDTVG